MMQGFRNEMEDAHCICLGLEGHPEVAFFGVYDGHSSDQVSKYIAEHLHHRIAKLGPEFEDDAIRELLVAFDQEVGKKEFAQDGSTCVFALVRPLAGDEGEQRRWRVTAVNVGDSRAMIVRANGSLVSLTEDHKPDDRAEGQRIMKAGGFVANGRTDGELAMSRAIGDFKYKMNSKLGPLEQRVIALPDITHDVVSAGDRLLIICDGLVERIDNRNVASAMHQLHKRHPEDPALAMRELIFHSLASGSTDNHSAVLVCFEDGSGYTAPDEFIAGPFSPWKDDRSYVAAYLKNAQAWGQTSEALPKLLKEADASMPKDWKRGLAPTESPFTVSGFLWNLLFLCVVYFVVVDSRWTKWFSSGQLEDADAEL